MKEKILQLRSEGKSYNEIKKILGCSKGTISYHCGEGQKKKNYQRAVNRRKETVICKRVENFRNMKDRSEDFQRSRHGSKGLGKRNLTFRWQDIIAKFGWQTTCYLTGRNINLKESKTYHFDHIVPYSRGGSSGLENLGIACKWANIAKSDMMLDEFIVVCKEVLEFSGYDVRKRPEVV